MAETLTLTTPEVKPDITTWRVRSMFLDVDAPAIKVELVANTGEAFLYRYVVSETVTAADVRAALSFINQGKFKTVQNKSLQRWLLDTISAQGVKVGTVSGTAD